MVRPRHLMPLAALALLAGCGTPESTTNTANTTPPAPSNSAPPVANAPAPDGTVDLGGLAAKTPEGWTSETAMAPRVAQYAIPPAEGDKEGAQLIVFHFGQGQGGTPESNIQRWAGWFEEEPGKKVAAPKAEVSEVNGMKLHRVDLKGTYVAQKSIMDPSQGKFNEPNYRMVGAILEAPEGSYYFRFVGPEKTVAANVEKFDQYLKDLKPAS